MSQFCYSFDNENFVSGLYDTAEAAIKAAISERKENSDLPNTVFIGAAKSHSNNRFYPDSSEIVEYMCCQADDVASEHAEGYPDVSDEALDELTSELHKLLDAWCIKHKVSPHFYSIGNVQEHSLPEV